MTGLTTDELAALMRESGRVLSQKRPSAAAGDALPQHVLDTAFEQGQRDARERAEWESPGEDSAVKTTPTTTTAPTGNDDTATAPVYPSVRTAREMSALPDPDGGGQVAGPVFRKGERVLVLGHPGHGKTALGYQAVRAATIGGDFLAWHVEGGETALIIDLEQGALSIKRALREAGLERSERVHVWAVPDGLRLDSSFADLDELRRILDELRPGIVLLDPLYKAHAVGDPNAERPIVGLMRILDGLRAAYGFCLVMPVHPRKPPTEQAGTPKLTIHDVSGSGAITRGAEVVLGLERLYDGAARLRLLKDRDGKCELPVGELWPLRFDRETGFRLDPDAESRKGPRKGTPAEIAAYVRDSGGTATPGAIRNEFGIGEATLRERRAPLAELGIDYTRGDNGGQAAYYVHEHKQTTIDPAADPAVTPRPHPAFSSHPTNRGVDSAPANGLRDTPRNAQNTAPRGIENAIYRDSSDPAPRAPLKGSATTNVGSATPTEGKPPDFNAERAAEFDRLYPRRGTP